MFYFFISGTFISFQTTFHIYIYIMSPSRCQHVTVGWLRRRRLAPALATVSVVRSLSVPSCSPSALPCSPLALPCSPSAPSCSLFAPSPARPQPLGALSSLISAVGVSQLYAMADMEPLSAPCWKKKPYMAPTHPPSMLCLRFLSPPSFFISPFVHILARNFVWAHHFLVVIRSSLGRFHYGEKKNCSTGFWWRGDKWSWTAGWNRPQWWQSS